MNEEKNKPTKCECNNFMQTMMLMMMQNVSASLAHSFCTPNDMKTIPARNAANDNTQEKGKDE